MRHISAGNLRSAIAIGQIMRRVIASGKITRADEFVLLQEMASDVSLSTEDMALLRNVMQRMDMGLIKVTD